MPNIKLSVLCPSIRTDRLPKLYESIAESFSGEFELIVISPYDLPPELFAMSNIKLIKSMANPISSQQQGLIAATGEFISWCSDDGIYTKDSLELGFQLLAGENYKTVICQKYLEGEENDGMLNDDYYYLRFHDSNRFLRFPFPYLMLNCGLVSRELLLEVGGWNAVNYEVCPMAYSDLAIRLQWFGAKFILQEGYAFTCSHMPGRTGDHGPIHDAQTQRDQPYFDFIYSDDQWKENIKIDINNWKKAPPIWIRRFWNNPEAQKILMASLPRIEKAPLTPHLS